MNCEEYREAIAADPSFDGGAGHLSECSACQAYRKEMLALDETIGRALAINVPELDMPDLPDVDTDNVVSISRRRVTARTWFAMAATVLIAAVLGVRMIGTDVQYESLADEVLAHVTQGEQYALRATDVPVSDERLVAVVPANVAQMNHDAGLITYAMTCVINGHDVPHLVIQGQHGPVTIILMPEEMVSGAIPLGNGVLDGVILPVGSGSIAIIGEREESLETIQENVLQSVAWTT